VPPLAVQGAAEKDVPTVPAGDALQVTFRVAAETLMVTVLEAVCLVVVVLSVAVKVTL